MLGFSELFFLFFLILFIFGPKKLPEISKNIGYAVGEFKKAQKLAEISNNFQVDIFDKYKNKENNYKINNNDIIKRQIKEAANKLEIDVEYKDDYELLSLILKNIIEK